MVSSAFRVEISCLFSFQNQFISQFIPTLLLWTMAAVLPLMVVYSDRFLNFWTRSLENHSVMRKTFIFLLFMVVILPSLGLTRYLKPSN